MKARHPYVLEVPALKDSESGNKNNYLSMAQEEEDETEIN
jgi:hypothetical protein